MLLFGGHQTNETDHVADPALLRTFAGLATGGFCFDSFRSDYPFWSPTWTEVLSGRSDLPSWPAARAGKAPETLARAFSRNGYETVLVTEEPKDRQAGALEFGKVIGQGCAAPDQLAGLALEQRRALAGRAGLIAIIWTGSLHTIHNGITHLLAGLRSSGHAEDLILVSVPPFLPAGQQFAACRPRLPLVVQWRHGIPTSGRSHAPMGPLDVAPTVCGLAGVARPDSFAGIDYSTIAVMRRPAA